MEWEPKQQKQAESKHQHADQAPDKLAKFTQHKAASGTDEQVSDADIEEMINAALGQDASQDARERYAKHLRAKFNPDKALDDAASAGHEDRTVSAAQRAAKAQAAKQVQGSEREALIESEDRDSTDSQAEANLKKLKDDKNASQDKSDVTTPYLWKILPHSSAWCTGHSRTDRWVGGY